MGGMGGMDGAVREVRATGLDGTRLATSLLQRARLADPLAGMWEAADVQWWWRRRQPSDQVEQLFWLDEDGPVAGVLLTSSGTDSWQCDPVVVPGSCCEPDDIWERALARAAEHAPAGFDVPVSDGDVFADVARRSGLTPGYRDSTGWMHAADRRAVTAPAGGFILVDRTQRSGVPHHLRRRSGDTVEQRLGQCSLYDPALDLVVESTSGRVAGYALFWFDPVTAVGLVEPVRVEDEFQRRGLASAMLSAGIDRLVARGAERVKISYGSDAAARTYEGVGFRATSTATWYRRPPG